MYALELAGEDDLLAVAEATTAGSGVERLATGLAKADDITPARIRTLALTHRAIDVISSGQGGAEAVREGIPERLPTAIPPGPIAVRARNMRGSADIDTQEVERTVGAVMSDRGFDIDLEDPEYIVRVTFADNRWVLGWSVAESIRDFGDRQPTDRPFFQPGGMAPLLARAVANLAIGPGDPSTTRLLDPMCGTGGILAEAGLIGAELIGGDVQPHMVAGTRENLSVTLPDAQYSLFVGDASQLPMNPGSVDVVALDAPYGRQSPVAGRDPITLLGSVLTAVRRLATRAVVVTDRDVTDLVIESGFEVRGVYERPVHRSLTRFLHVLE